MKIVLASIVSKTNGIIENKNRIIDLIERYSNKTNLIIFGEAYLQGFYALNFNYERDINIAITINDNIINEIKKSAKNNNVAVSFGFIENNNGLIYSSQLTISSKGEVIDIFRRVSPGWKTLSASNKYVEGKGFHVFTLSNHNIAIGLCGDLWYEENVKSINSLNPDIVLWPVHTDYSPSEWNKIEKYEYCSQAKKICNKVLYVNSVCLDIEKDEIAKGGSAYFSNGKIVSETPSGIESELLINI